MTLGERDISMYFFLYLHLRSHVVCMKTDGNYEHHVKQGIRTTVDGFCTSMDTERCGSKHSNYVHLV